MAATSDESRSGDLYQILRWNLDSVRSLPSPRWPWSWWRVVEVGPVSKQLAVKLRNDGHIVPADRDGYCRTTRRLAEYIEARFDDVTLDPVGQARLPVDVSTPGNTSNTGRGDTDRATGAEHRQIGLEGADRTAEYRARLADRDQELYETRVANGRRGEPTWMRVGGDAEQLPLDAFGASPVRVGRLARSAGGVYDSPSPA
jgi:hypothetical protein